MNDFKFKNILHENEYREEIQPPPFRWILLGISAPNNRLTWPFWRIVSAPTIVHLLYPIFHALAYVSRHKQNATFTTFARDFYNNFRAANETFKLAIRKSELQVIIKCIYLDNQALIVISKFDWNVIDGTHVDSLQCCRNRLQYGML